MDIKYAVSNRKQSQQEMTSLVSCERHSLLELMHDNCRRLRQSPCHHRYVTSKYRPVASPASLSDAKGYSRLKMEHVHTEFPERGKTNGDIIATDRGVDDKLSYNHVE